MGALNGDEQFIIFSHLCSTLEPGFAVAFSSTNSELWALTAAQRQQLQDDYEAATALSLKLCMRSCKDLREKDELFGLKRLSSDDLCLLGTLGSMLPALKRLQLSGQAGPDGVQRLVEKLGAGALPAVHILSISDTHVGDAGASALAGALGRGALPRLKVLELHNAAIGDVGLVALAPALRRRPMLEFLYLNGNPLGDEGLAALVAPPQQPAGAPPSPLRSLSLDGTRITSAGCATLAAALDCGALPSFCDLYLRGTRASAAAKAALRRAGLSVIDRAGRRGR